jgi:hypothetical protein
MILFFFHSAPAASIKMLQNAGIIFEIQLLRNFHAKISTQRTEKKKVSLKTKKIIKLK